MVLFIIGGVWGGGCPPYDQFWTVVSDFWKKIEFLNKELESLSPDIEPSKQDSLSLIDIHLDCEKGQLRLCVVGNCDSQHEAILNGLNEFENKKGWVPHFNFGNVAFDTEIRLAKIPNSWYGKHSTIIKWE